MQDAIVEVVFEYGYAASGHCPAFLENEDLQSADVIAEMHVERGCDEQEQMHVIGHDAVLEELDGRVQKGEPADMLLYDFAMQAAHDTCRRELSAKMAE